MCGITVCLYCFVWQHSSLEQIWQLATLYNADVVCVAINEVILIGVKQFALFPLL